MNRPTLPPLPRLQGLLALIALFAALAVAGAIYHGLRLRSEALRAHHDIAHNLVRVGERELTGTLTLVERTLVSRGDGPLSAMTAPEGDEHLRQDIAQMPTLRSLSLVDARGRILASSTSGARGHQLAPEAMAALTGPAGVPMQVSVPWRGRDLVDGVPAYAPIDVRQSPYFFTLARQSAGPGGPVWMVAAIHPDFFTSFLATVADRQDFAIELYRYDGVLLTSTQNQNQIRGRQPGYSAAQHPVFREWLPEREIGGIDADLSDGEPQILAFRASSRYPVVLQVRLPYEAVLAGWREEVNHLLLGVSGSLLFVTLLSWLLYRQQQRRHAAQALIRAEIELAARVFEASYDGILITDAQRRILRVNAAFTRMTAYTQDDVQGKTPRLLSSGMQNADFYAAMWKSLARDGQWQGELINRRKNGEHFPERLAISTVHDAAGQITHYIATFADISERKRQEAELQQARDRAEAANLAKSQFLAVMSHEIRTPMNGILGMAQLLQSPELGRTEQREYASTIFQSGQVLLTLLNDILDLSKVEAGKMELSPIPVDPAQVLQEVATLFAEAAQRKGLALYVEWQSLPHHCYSIDALRLRQMLTNLLNNAIKFTSRGQIRLSVCELERQGAQARLRIDVSDTGIGIAPDRQAALFQPFSQVDSSSTRRFGGTGLGLSIVASLARLMHGEVGVDSVEGQGTHFWFTLVADVLTPVAGTPAPTAAPAPVPTPTLPPAPTPMPETPPPPAPVAAAPAEPAPAPGSELLVVEDNAVNRKVIQAMLKRLGRPLHTVEDGLQAVQYIQQGGRPALVLMDCQMPVMDGYEATRQIRQWQRARQADGHAAITLPIVALTAGAFDTERQACLDAGMDDFLAKPLELKALRAMIDRWVPPASPPHDPGAGAQTPP
jgi:PAS domain S-box-containing protein